MPFCACRTSLIVDIHCKLLDRIAKVSPTAVVRGKKRREAASMHTWLEQTSVLVSKRAEYFENLAPETVSLIDDAHYWTLELRERVLLTESMMQVCFFVFD